MATYVLIHSAFGGNWIWDNVKPRLEAAGHTVIAPDLPGHGVDQTPRTTITLQTYADRVVEALDAAPEPAILVGHSLGGFIMSQGAELRPERVRKLVYIAAFLLPDGSCPRHLYEELKIASPVVKHCTVSEDGILTLNPAALRDMSYNTSPPEAAERAAARLVPMARKPLGTPLKLTDANFGRIPRVYIHTLQDNAIPTDVQKHMLARMPCAQVITMNTDHSPMYSAPDELVRHLLSVAD